MATKKLIEVALPLEKINEEAEREKHITQGHPAALHLWWARRPLAAARAVIWASLVDDPSAHPDRFPTEELQNKERLRLFRILEQLVVWENSNDERVLNAAKAEIQKSTNNNPPAFLDPFSGGGAIPLEARRLGLESHAHDLNPVAVTINKAMEEIPSLFAGQYPVNEESQRTIRIGNTWNGTSGLAEDVRYYGEWMLSQAQKEIGHLYPKASVGKGEDATVLTWIWARTVKCPNPTCGCELPLASNLVLAKKKEDAWAEPIYENGKLKFVVHRSKCPKGKESTKIGRSGQFKCVVCGATTTTDYIRTEALNGKMSARLVATIAKNRNGRMYLSPDVEQELAAEIGRAHV